MTKPTLFVSFRSIVPLLAVMGIFQAMLVSSEGFAQSQAPKSSGKGDDAASANDPSVPLT